MSSEYHRCLWPRRLALSLLLGAMLAVLGVASGASQPGGCGPVSAAGTVDRYTREDVLAGRLPGEVPITRVTLGVGSARLEAAVVTDAARNYLAADWPPLPRQTRLMLVALESGDALWQLAAAAEVTSSAVRTTDPRLFSALGGAAALLGSDGLLRRLYAGDAAGRVWRVDLPPAASAGDAALDWQVDLLAALAPSAAPASTRFRLPPDLVRSVDSGGRPFDGVVLASGGAAPEPAPGEGNGVYFLRDYAVDPRRASDRALPLITRTDLIPATDRPPTTPAAVGWFAPFRNPGEVAQQSPLTDGGRVFLVTAAAPADCAEPPLTLTYIFNIADGRPLADTLPGSVAGVGRLGGPQIEGGDIVLPGRGIAVPAPDGGFTAYRRRFVGAGVGGRVSYWRDLLLDAE